MSPLDADQLRALLHDAVDDIRPSPDGYERIRAGIARRQRWRVPAIAAGTAALAGVAAIAFFAVQPHNSTQLVEPASPITSAVGPNGGSTATPRSTLGPPESASRPPRAGAGNAAGATLTATPTTHSTATTRPTPTATGGGDQGSPTAPARDGDIDGDGKPDTVHLSASGLSADLSSGGLVLEVSVAGLDVSAPRSTVTDIDQDGRGEIVVQVSGGSAQTYEIVRLAPDGKSLVALSGGPLPLTVSSSSSAGAGFSCGDGLIKVRTGTSDDGETYTVSTTVWRLSGTSFKQVGKGASTTWEASSKAPSPFVADCGSL